MEIRKSELKKILSLIKGPEKPSLRLEQYETPVQLASDLLWVAATTFDDIASRKVVDLGCGSGRLAVGATLLGASYVIGVDIDKRQILLAKNYSKKFGVFHKVDFVVADVAHFALARKVDTVVQNPPFGVHRRGIDIVFLKTALSLANTVYTIHKASTASYIESKVPSLGGKISHKAIGLITIPRIHSHHKEKIHKVKVIIYRIKSIK